MKEMTEAICNAVSSALKEEDLDGAIPSGEMMLALASLGTAKVHRDTFHASYGLGRYALSLVWLKALTGKSVANNPFADLDEPVTAEALAAARACADRFTLIV